MDAEWIQKEYFPGLSSGWFLEIYDRNSTHQQPLCKHFTLHNWAGLLATDKPVQLDTSLLSIIMGDIPPLQYLLQQWTKKMSSNYIHLVICSNGKFLKNIDQSFPKNFRCGAIAVQYPKGKSTHTRYKTKQYLTLHNYQLTRASPTFEMYVSSIGSPPLYYGQPVFRNFKVKGTFKAGCGSTSVFLLKNIHDKKLLVLKIAANQQQYQAEKDALLQLTEWKYSPTLINYHDTKRYLVTDYCGKEMRGAKPHKKKWAKPRIKQIVNELYTRYGLFHNDIRWKNIVKKGKELVLIDWGLASTTNNEKNHEGII